MNDEQPEAGRYGTWYIEQVAGSGFIGTILLTNIRMHEINASFITTPFSAVYLLVYTID
jgi:hypothetical protein